MSKKWLLILVGLIGASIIALAFLQTSKDSPRSSADLPVVTTADSGKWVGFAPFYLAKELGLDVQNGVNLQLQKVGSSDARRQMLASNQVDFLPPTIDGAVFNANAGMDVKIVMAYDASNGGDGIVSKSDISTISDLRGRKIAATKGFTSYFFLLYVLNKNGISQDEVQIIDMSDEEIGPALLAGEIDAGFLMEPWLSKIANQEGFNALVTSKDEPGLINDVVLVSNEALENKREAVLAVMQTWFDAVEYWKLNQNKANEIMAKEYSMTQEEFSNAIAGVLWLDQKQNLDYFGTADSPGDVFSVTQSIADVALSEEMISKSIQSSEIIDSSLLDTFR